MKFYLIDDDRNILNVLKRIITDRGLGTICGCAQNGRDGLEDFEREKPDIVIVDVLMPEMDGISLVQKQSHCSRIRHLLCFLRCPLKI